MEHLGVRAKDNGMMPGSYWHFGNHEALLKQFRDVEAQIPIRNPLDVATAWGRRPKSGDSLSSMLRHYEAMFRFIENNEHRCKFYKMEDLPRLAGSNEYPDESTDTPKVRLFRDSVMENVVEPHREFFERFYECL